MDKLTRNAEELTGKLKKEREKFLAQDQIRMKEFY